MRNKNLAEPQTRVGNCCGCDRIALLFKVQGIFRYRCTTCYQQETGHRHYLDVAITQGGETL